MELNYVKQQCFPQNNYGSREMTPDFKMAAVQTGSGYILGMERVRDEIPTAKTTFPRSLISKISRPTSNDTRG